MTNPPRDVGPPEAWAELTPLVRRAAALDPGTLVRLTRSGGVLTVWVALPFDVLASRTVPAPDGTIDLELDLAAAAGETLSWLDGVRSEPPAPLDLLWRGSLPPRLGWRRLDVVPDTAIRDVVRAGAREIKSLGGTAPRREQALLDAVVLTAESDGAEAKITLRVAAALTRMGFLPRDSHAGVDVVGRWIRLTGGYGAVYTEQPGAGLSVV
jgi:hypothetical protein